MALLTLSPGAHLGPCDIVAKLGEGGMGEVYRARDPRLDRQVAINLFNSIRSEPRFVTLLKKLGLDC